ncbi:MAG: large conductance mechanosensitive channel protein MscL [Candidatus Sumerlaeaceae bacterium]
MNKMLKEFREFAMKGSVVDLAVGLIVGGAFGKIVDSLVKDILMPPIGVILKGVDFSNLKLVLLPGTSPTVTTSTQVMPQVLSGTVTTSGTTVTELFTTTTATAVTSVGKAAEEVAIRYGLFLNTLIHFLIVSFAVYLLVKQINRLKQQLEKPTPTTRECPRCTSLIALRATRCPQCTADIDAGLPEHSVPVETPT